LYRFILFLCNIICPDGLFKPLISKTHSLPTFSPISQNALDKTTLYFSFLKASSSKYTTIMVAVVSSGGTLLSAVPYITTQAAAVQVAAATTATEAAFSAAVAAQAVGFTTAAQAGLSAAVAAESAATAAAGFTAANIWNPAGWAIGAVLVGASQCPSHAVTWGCYKPVISQVDTGETSIQPISFAKLVANPEVRRVSIGAIAASAGLPEVEIENQGGNRFLLRGVALPWGSVAYHAEREGD
jgi:hypothetical protein